MDLYPDSASDSELDGCGNPDNDGDFETAGSDISVLRLQAGDIKQ